jgi:hypothetical protein
LRDLLADKLRSKNVEQIVDEMVDSLLDHQATSDPFLKRRKWCLAQIHTRKELETVVREGLKSFTGLNGLGELGDAGKASTTRAMKTAGKRAEPDVLYGNDTYEADLYDAWFGILTWRGGHSGDGGATWGSADDIDWGEEIGVATFENMEDAQEFAAELAKDGMENTGAYVGADGKIYVRYDFDSSD